MLIIAGTVVPVVVAKKRLFAVEMAECIKTAVLIILNQYETEFAVVFVAQKG